MSELVALREKVETLEEANRQLLDTLRPVAFSLVPYSWKFTAGQRRMFLYLLNHGHATKDTLHYAQSRGPYYPDTDIKIVDVQICKMRKLLRNAGVPPLIETVWGEGYRIVNADKVKQDIEAGVYGQ